MREGSVLLDPTRGMTPTSAARQRERFKKMIAESEERIRVLKQRREEFCNAIDDKIEKEFTYIQESELVIRSIDEAFGGDYLDIAEAIIHHSDCESERQVMDADESKNEIILYGTPIY
jgi:hypothetical protein